MKLVSFTIVFIIFISLILPAMLSFGIRSIPQSNQPSLDKTQKLYGDLVVTQLFLSTNDNFSGLGFSIKNPNLLNKKDVVLSVYAEDGKLERSTFLNGAGIEDGKFVKFRFEPIKISKNKKFLFYLSSPETSKAEADENRALEVFLTNEKPVNVFSLTIGDKIISDSNISFVAFYKPPHTTYVLENIYSKWIKNFAADVSFFVVYLVLIFILSGLLLYQLSKSRQHH